MTSQIYTLNQHGFHSAVENGDLKYVQYLVSQKVSYLRNHVCDLAASQGHLLVLKYLHEELGCPVSNETIRVVSKDDNLKYAEFMECLAYLHGKC